MADALFTTQSSVGLATPAAGTALVFIDSVGKILCVKDDAGRIAAYSDNASTAAQGAGFATDTWVTNSDILIPTFGFLQTKTKFTWMLSASKTAAGVAQPIYVIRTGSNRSTADTARLTLTGPAQTAIADIGTLYIEAVVRSVGASGVIAGSAAWLHQGTVTSSTGGTGFANNDSGHIEGNATFDMTALSGLYASLSINGGLNAAWTVTWVKAEAVW